MSSEMKPITDALRLHWSFDKYQLHTHSWHDREDFIEKTLPRLIDALIATRLTAAESSLAEARAEIERLRRCQECERCRGRGWFRGGHAEDDFEIACNDCRGTGRTPPLSSGEQS